MKEWVATRSNNARVVCPNKDITPPPWSSKPWHLVGSMQILFFESIATVLMIELLPVLVQGLNVLNYWQAFLKKPLQLAVSTLLWILNFSTILDSSFYMSHSSISIITSFLSTNSEVVFVALMTQRVSRWSGLRQWCNLCTLKVFPYYWSYSSASTYVSWYWSNKGSCTLVHFRLRWPLTCWVLIPWAL